MNAASHHRETAFFFCPGGVFFSAKLKKEGIDESGRQKKHYLCRLKSKVKKR